MLVAWVADVTIRDNQTVADQKTGARNACPYRRSLVTEPHMIGTINVANGIVVTIQDYRGSRQFLLQLLHLSLELANLCRQIIDRVFFGSSTSGMTSDPTHQQHGDSRHNNSQHPLATVKTDSSYPSLFQVQVERLDATAVSVVA